MYKIISLLSLFALSVVTGTIYSADRLKKDREKARQDRDIKDMKKLLEDIAHSAQLEQEEKEVAKRILRSLETKNKR